jgi:hypothetical protein
VFVFLLLGCLLLLQYKPAPVRATKPDPVEDP